MQDPKWIGTSPKNVFWSYNNRDLYFDWNPEKSASDSLYVYRLNSKQPVKVPYWDARLAEAISNGEYNLPRTQVAYIFKGDLWLLDVASGSSIRLTQTAAIESNPQFLRNDIGIVYQSGGNLFLFTVKTGFTRQLTNFAKGNRDKEKPLSAEEDWLQRDAIHNSEVLTKQKNKREQAKAYLDSIKDADTIHRIYTGEQDVVSLQSSPDARFVTYQLLTDAAAKKTIVPAYVTESGYTTPIPTREKVGAPQGSYALYVFDRQKDTVQKIAMDSLPGIDRQPDYVKDYPQQGKDSTRKRGVYVSEWVWNDEGSMALADIRSTDFKDRWIMQFDTAHKTLQLVDHQHDDAWIAGPGIGWLSQATLGFLDEHTTFFMSEESGYAHLYRYDMASPKKTALTSGKYEVGNARLSHDKQYFYLVTNEEHPGKQRLVRINKDGSHVQQLTSMTGGYEVVLSPDEQTIAYRYSYQTKPWELYVQGNGTNRTPQQITYKAASDEWKAYPWRDTRIFSFPARDGKPVYARVYEPAAGKKNGAAVIFVHGAGYLQNVDYGWSSSYFREAMFNNLLADKGYTVLDIDYRASEGYGRDWRTGIYRHMGGKDLNDEVDAARMLVQQFGIDSSRIGMYGGSYGGFMTLMAMFTQPTVFKAGAALRPVTDWAHYNHTYTAAILNEPFTDSLAYARSSPINFAEGLQNHLLICHGMVDVNVHFEDAVRLAQRLIELGKNNWELAVYPVENHGFTEPSSWTDEYKRILKLFDDNLLVK